MITKGDLYHRRLTEPLKLSVSKAEHTPFLVEVHHEESPFGAEGVGEPAAAPPAPAIANAIFDAVGIRIRDLPITSEKVLAGLKAKGK